MFFFWMLVSMALPVIFLGFAIGFGMLLVRNAEISDTTIDRVRRRNPVSPYERYEPGHMMDVYGRRSWESASESEVQKLRRRSMGGYH